MDWSARRDAAVAAAMQGAAATFGEHEPARNEDCLMLMYGLRR